MSQVKRIQSLLWFFAISLMTGCASFTSTKPEPIKVFIPDREWWSNAENSHHIATRNLATVRQRLSDIVPMRYTLALSNQSEINAYAAKKSGLTLVIITDGFMKAFGDDPDVLATTLGHELAHHSLGHTDPTRRNNKTANQEVASTLLGNVANFFLPFSGFVLGMLVKTASLSFDRDDERDADELGMKWALQANFSPCGNYRLAKRLKEMDKESSLNFLSTHPGNSERMDNAEKFEKSTRQKSCLEAK